MNASYGSRSYKEVKERRKNYESRGYRAFQPRNHTGRAEGCPTQGRRIYDPGGGAFGLIGQGEQYIWIYTNKDSLQKDTAGFLNMLKHDQPDVLEEIQKKLGGVPRTYFEIVIRRTPGSQQLALDFAIDLAETWPCVFVDLPPPRGVVFSKEELLHLREKGKGLLADETPPGA